MNRTGFGIHVDQPAGIDPDQITQVSTADASTPWRNFNPFLNTIADEQGVEVGSWPWVQAGPAAWSGSSGSQASYGWRHHHKVDDNYIRAVLANYGHRRSYYGLAPFRQFGYAAGGRPKGWAPEDPGDQPDGSTVYLTSGGKAVIVSGPDAEHFWLNPLWAVIDSPPINVKALGKTFPSTVIARLMATHLTQSIVGQIRDSSGGETQQPYPWAYGDRANSRILDTIIQAFKRNCLLADDVATCVYWIRDVILPWYEKAPGISRFGTAPAGMFPVGTFNGLYWILTVCYDAALTLQASPYTKDLGDRFMVLVGRWSQWALELEETVPGKGFNMSRFYVDDVAFRKSNGGKPLDSIKALLDPANVVFDLTWETWAYRAASIAAKVTGSDTLKQAAAGIFKRRGGDPQNKGWMVDADGEYVQ